MSRTKHHTPNYESGTGNFNLSYHLEMVSDNERVQRGKEAIDFYIKSDSIFCELGCGTGIFSIYAAKKCKKVYAVEYDENILKVAKENAKNNGVEDKIEFIHADAMGVRLPEKADIIFCEMMSIWLINEPQVEVMNNAIKYNLKEGGAVIPQRIINLVELGNMDYMFDGVEIKTSIAEFSGIRPPRVASESRMVNTINLYENNPKKINTTVKLKSVINENINCARLFSIVEFAPKINFHSTDTLMPITTIPLENTLDVKADDEMILDIEYEHRTSVDEAIFKIRKVDE